MMPYYFGLMPNRKFSINHICHSLFSLYSKLNSWFSNLFSVFLSLLIKFKNLMLIKQNSNLIHNCLSSLDEYNYHKHISSLEFQSLRPFLAKDYRYNLEPNLHQKAEILPFVSLLLLLFDFLQCLFSRLSFQQNISDQDYVIISVSDFLPVCRVVKGYK